MTEGYIPTFLADEITPPPRSMPDDWIIAKDGRFYIGDDDDSAAITNGEAAEFMRLETFPDSKLTIEDDKTWKVDPPAPKSDQVMIAYDSDTMDDSIESLVQNNELDPGTYHLHFYTWHDEVWSFDAAAGKFLRGAA